MARIYVFLMVLFISTLFGGLVWLHFQLKEKALKEAFTYEETTLGDAIESTNNRLEKLARETNYQLLPINMIKYYPIRNVFDIAADGRASVIDDYEMVRTLKESDRSVPIEKIIATIIRENDRFWIAIEELLESNKQAFDPKNADIQIIENRMMGYSGDQVTNYPAGGINQDKLMVLKFLTGQEKVLSQLSAFTKKKNVSVDKFFPIVNMSRANPIPGAAIEAEISVGSYFANLDPANVQLMVGSDTLSLSEDGTILVREPTFRRGIKTLRMECRITNPYTGEVASGQGRYTYEVY